MKDPIVVRLYNFVRDGLAVIGGVLIVAMVVYVSLSVIVRFFGFTIGWTLEVAEYSLIIMTMFGAGWLVREGYRRYAAHIVSPLMAPLKQYFEAEDVPDDTDDGTATSQHP